MATPATPEVRAAWLARRRRVWAAQVAEWTSVAIARAEYRSRVLLAGDWARERQRCADPGHYLRWWVDTYAPKSRPPYEPPDPAPPLAWTWRPFILRPTQVELLEQLRGLSGTACWVKSRDEGASWLVCAYDAHQLLFGSESAVHVSSHEDLVDNWLLSSLLGKAWSVIDRTPRELWPEGGVTRSFKSIVTGDRSIVGVVAGSGVAGGRTTNLRVDEAAQLELSKGYQLRQATTSLAASRLLLSTPNGPVGMFAEECLGGQVPVTDIGWQSNPTKACDHAPSEPHVTCWYAEEISSMTRADIASQLDRDFYSSVQGQIWPALSRGTHLEDDPARWAELLECHPGQWVVGIDVGVGPAATALVLARWCRSRSAVLVDWALECWAWAAYDVGKALVAELMGRGITPAALVADPSAWARDPQQRSWIAHCEDGMRAAGWRGPWITRAGAQSDKGTRDTVGMLAEGRVGAGAGLLRFGPRASLAFDRAAAYRWQQGPRVQQVIEGGRVVGVTGHVGESSPRKDEASHLADALQDVVAWCLPSPTTRRSAVTA